MSQTDNSVSFALSFPQGHILFMQRGDAYFVPANTMDGFQIYGEGKELFGKRAITVRGNRDGSTPDYSVVYEFNDQQQLTDARLITRDQTLRGTLADADTINTFKGALAQGALTLYTTRDTQPDRVSRVARFTDGRYLILVSAKDDVIYIGTPGNYQKLDAHLYVQGGNSLYFRTSTNEEIALPYGLGGPRHGELPTYKGEELNYVSIKQNGDPAEFGLVLAGKQQHLSPFHPDVVKANQGGTPPAPKA